MAPELCEAIMHRQSVSEYSQAIDCYAFGVIMWEILAMQAPWKGKKYRFSSQIMTAVEAGKRPPLLEIATTEPAGYCVLMAQCWAQDAADRPTFDSILLALNAMEKHQQSGGDEETKIPTSDPPVPPFGSNGSTSTQAGRAEELVSAASYTLDLAAD